MKTSVCTKTGTQRATAALHIIPKSGNKPSVRQRDSLWSVCAMEYDSAMKRNEGLTHATRRVNLGNIMWRESSQAQKAT